jgi:hypothetical protein
MNLENFDWGSSSEHFKSMSIREHFNEKIYLRHFDIDKGDVVVDIGSSVGDFAFSILDKEPKHIWVIEPIVENFISLKNNLMGHPVSFLYGAISNYKSVTIDWDGKISTPTTKTFSEFIKDNYLEKIDFLKGDCEGCEYDIFIEENMNFLMNNVSKMVFEFHLNNPVEKELFRIFRDKTIKKFKKVIVNSTDGINIEWDLWNEHFLEYYRQVLIYFDNR